MSGRSDETKAIMEGSTRIHAGMQKEISFNGFKVKEPPTLKDKEKIWDDIYSNTFLA